MKTRVALLGVAGVLLLGGSWGHGATTLYPMTNSTNPLPPAPIVVPETFDTNQVAAPSSLSVTLTPTAIASPGASAVAEIKPHAVLLHITHLQPGRYELQIVRRSNYTPKTAGMITIVDPTLGPSRQANDNKKEASANPDSVRIDTNVQINLTSELSPQDLARILLLGPGGNAVLVGEVK